MKHTRRTYLAVASGLAVGTAAIAGCMGNDDGLETEYEGVDVADVETTYECELTDRDPVSDLPQPRVGPDEAEITVAVFEDFGCPACREFALGALADLKADFADDDTVAFDHYDYPVQASEWSERIANAARSVQDANDDAAFFEFSTAAYESQGNHSWQGVGDIADDVGSDPCDVLSDATHAVYAPVLQSNLDEGWERGVEGTPTVFVNESQVDASYDAVQTAIENAE